MDYRRLTRKLTRMLRNEREAAAQLANQVGELQHELSIVRANLDEAHWAAESAQQQATAKVRAARGDADEARQEAEDAEYRNRIEIRRATEDLERARSYGGGWAEEQALDKLKRLGRGY